MPWWEKTARSAQTPALVSRRSSSAWEKRSWRPSTASTEEAVPLPRPGSRVLVHQVHPVELPLHRRCAWVIGHGLHEEEAMPCSHCTQTILDHSVHDGRLFVPAGNGGLERCRRAGHPALKAGQFGRAGHVLVR